MGCSPRAGQWNNSCRISSAQGRRRGWSPVSKLVSAYDLGQYFLLSYLRIIRSTDACECSVRSSTLVECESLLSRQSTPRKLRCVRASSSKFKPVLWPSPQHRLHVCQFEAPPWVALLHGCHEVRTPEAVVNKAHGTHRRVRRGVEDALSAVRIAGDVAAEPRAAVHVVCLPLRIRYGTDSARKSVSE